ncbi:hypothetical protein [Clostridium thermarum]|uniref:hypothetical protein n=1 Tax=Clostridium thermarum TaxID=1716543 RepID=UPI0013D1A74F|nr:hypothetical protein [Clostridium thermarum]
MKKKKVLSMIVTSILTVALIAGCSSAKKTEEGNKTDGGTKVEEGAIVKLGLGQSTSIAKSKDADGADVTALGQVDTIMAAVGFDKDGKVVSVTIDNAQTKVEFNKDLTLKSDVNAELKTKVELKDGYGMKKASAIGKEWYEQIAELEKWMVGKTVEEIKAMKTVKKDDSHPAVPDEADLKSSVSISVEGYIAVVEEAYKNAVEVKGGAVKVGLGHNVSIAKSKGLATKDGKEVLPLAQVDTVMVASAFDKDGKVAAALIDNAQTKVNFDNTGKVTSDKAAELKTKVELKEEYGMKKASAIGKEWYEQAAALQDWMVGKTVEEIKAMKTVKKDDSHPAVPDEADLKSSVSISVQDYLAALEESSKNAK